VVVVEEEVGEVVRARVVVEKATEVVMVVRMAAVEE
jgi:hypothetical protein